jgi:UDP-2-acetamido-3-amino-2,3-dideoxy-glucuronate N-acetyltransferase
MNHSGIRIGVVGAGYWGPNLIRNCFELGVLDSICDIYEAALGAARQMHPSVATTTQFDTLLARQIDAVIIAAPAQFHTEMALKAIAAGKHVFVEKPLALNVEEANRIAAAARAAGVLVFVGHLLLYHPAVRKLRSLIAERVIGDVWLVRSRRLSLGKLRSHENVWWSFAPHDVALVLAIFGEEPRAAVSAQASAKNTGISDVGYADFEFSRGRTAHVEVSWLDPERSAQLDVFGTRGVLSLADSRKGSSLTLKPFALSKDQRGAPVAIRGEEQNVDFDNEEPLRVELQAFVDSIVTGKPAETDAKQGIAVLRALSIADDAARRVEGVPA